MNIYNYENPSQFLFDTWKQKHQNNSNFTIAAWSAQVGLSSQTILYDIIRGRRHVAARYIPLLADFLELSENEKKYFETMISLKKAKKEEEKEYFYCRLMKLKQAGSFKMVEMNDFSPFENPIHINILETLALKNAPKSIEELQSILVTKPTTQEIEDSLKHLESVELIEKTNVFYKKKTDFFITSKKDHDCLYGRNFQKKLLQVAAQQMENQPLQMREFNSYVINIKKNDLAKAKKMITDFVRNFAASMEAPPETGDETYNLSVNFFGLTQSSRKNIHENFS